MKLPDFKKSFFVNYECADRNDNRSEIYSLQIYSEGNIIDFRGDEAQAIRGFVEYINYLNNKGFTAVHFDDYINSIYGINHIISRFYQLRDGGQIHFIFKSDFCLKDYLKHSHGLEFVKYLQIENLPNLEKYKALEVKIDIEKEKVKNLLFALKVFFFIEEFESLKFADSDIIGLNIQNNFDSIQIEDVANHFRKGLVEKRYLAEEDLISFLNLAFDKRILPEKRFQLRNKTTKQKINHVFYEYFRVIAGKPQGRRIEYAALLGDYFEGYKTTTVSTNFNR